MNTNTNPNVVPVSKLPFLLEKFEGFAKRAHRLRKPAPELHEVGRFIERELVGYNLRDEPVYRRIEMVELEVVGERPVLGEWEPIANLVHAKGMNVVRTREGFTLPEEYKERQICDHCGHNRRRNDTWVLRHMETGELRQIGRQCLQDFIGSVELVPAFLALWADVWAPLATDEDGNPYGRQYFSVAEYLAACAAIIRVNRGFFVSKKKAEETGQPSTASEAFEVLNELSPAKRAERGLPDITPDDVDAANKALDWCATWTEHGDYPHNVRASVSLGFVKDKTAGFVASLIGTAWPNALKKAETLRASQAIAQVSEHIGKVGDRMPFMLTITKVRGWEGSFGWTTFVEMKDENKNTLVWYASGEHNFTEGATIELTGTIKKHDTDRYTGGKVTVLTRCKVKP